MSLMSLIPAGWRETRHLNGHASLSPLAVSGSCGLGSSQGRGQSVGGVRSPVSPDLLEFGDEVKSEPEGPLPFLAFLPDNCQRRGECLECVRTASCLQGPRDEITGRH